MEAEAETEEDKIKMDERLKIKQTQDKLVKLLREGRVDLFNIERNNPTYFFEFPDVDLSNISLSGANLADTILTGANLSGSDLSGAVLNRANLSNANLSFVTSYSDLKCEKANFMGARITLRRFGKYLKDHGAINISVFPL